MVKYRISLYSATGKWYKIGNKIGNEHSGEIEIVKSIS
jgi:hypothetical protein